MSKKCDSEAIPKTKCDRLTTQIANIRPNLFKSLQNLDTFCCIFKQAISMRSRILRDILMAIAFQKQYFSAICHHSIAT